MDGFINVLKPPGLTSHDVVDHIRKAFHGIKVGHGGTLDPGAAGVLPILLGRATRLSSYLLDFSKVYRAELLLGLSTDTADSFGKVIAQKEVPSLNIQVIERVLDLFKGEIEQIPPMFAAVKHKGKKLYQYAREGITIERKPRTVQIYSIELIDYIHPARIIFDVKCSKGTYIRTLCAQIGDALSCGGHMSFLLRKEVGKFILPDSYTLEEVNNFVINEEREYLLPMDFLFQGLDHLVLDQDKIKSLIQGCSLSYKNLFGETSNPVSAPVDEKLMPVYTTKREFTALARWKSDSQSSFVLKPEKVFKTLEELR
ncbi:MAG: tRNA pseudouridine(55) synthase TruB [Bacillota bacterium]|nr:tRNA pseudouridine(55) synthase TruB [Bacillota bacterium]